MLYINAYALIFQEYTNLVNVNKSATRMIASKHGLHTYYVQSTV